MKVILLLALMIVVLKFGIKYYNKFILNNKGRIILEYFINIFKILKFGIVIIELLYYNIFYIMGNFIVLTKYTLIKR